MVQPIAVQLYTLRDAAATDIRPVLDRLGAKGFAGVETAGLAGLSGAQFRAALDQAGLRASSCHINYAGREAFRRELDEHAALDVDTVIIPFAAPEEFSTTDGIAKLADRLNRAAGIGAEAGVRVGYHNHFWEFSVEHGGRSGWATLWDQLDPAVVAEVDIYWAAVGGDDPVSVIRSLGDRVTRVHVKDGPARRHDDPMVAVGSGVIDVTGALDAATAAQWHIVELDSCETDMFEAVEASYDYLVGQGLSAGRA